MVERHTSDYTRRRLLGTALGATAGAYGLTQGLTGAPQVWAAPDFKLRAPEPNAKRGGVFRYGILSAPAHFDIHQSGTVSNMGTQGAMYDNLIRRNPLDSGQTIIPDLAHSWEIAPDSKTYTFFLRTGVQFHDGEELVGHTRQLDRHRAGLFFTPLDPRSNNLRVFAVFAALSGVQRLL